MPRIYNTELYYTPLSIIVLLHRVNFAHLRKLYTLFTFWIHSQSIFFTLIIKRMINVFPLSPWQPPPHPYNLFLTIYKWPLNPTIQNTDKLVTIYLLYKSAHFDNFLLRYIVANHHIHRTTSGIHNVRTNSKVIRPKRLTYIFSLPLAVHSVGLVLTHITYAYIHMPITTLYITCAK